VGGGGGDGGGWWVEWEFSVLLWSKPFPSGLCFGFGPSRTMKGYLLIYAFSLVSIYFKLKF
jgi:hypothetical protein